MGQIYVTDHAVQRLLQRGYGLDLPWGHEASGDVYHERLVAACRAAGLTLDEARAAVLPSCPYTLRAIETLQTGVFPHDRFNLFLQVVEGGVVTVFQKGEGKAKRRQRRRQYAERNSGAKRDDDVFDA